MKISVVVHPNSRRPRVEKDTAGLLHVHVNAPPQEGKANKAVREALAENLGIGKGKITLVRGEKSKIKAFEIE